MLDCGSTVTQLLLKRFRPELSTLLTGEIRHECRQGSTNAPAMRQVESSPLSIYYSLLAIGPRPAPLHDGKGIK
jgi:hypothetical protein